MQSPPERQETRPPIPEMVGATEAPFYIGPGITEIDLRIHPPTGPARETTRHREVILQVENITGDKNAPAFEVYLNLPIGAAPEKYPGLFAGNLGLFGLVQASRPKGKHPGHGLTIHLDATAVVARLTETKAWDASQLRISFVAADWDAPVPKVRVGRVSLYFQ